MILYNSHSDVLPLQTLPSTRNWWVGTYICLFCTQKGHGKMVLNFPHHNPFQTVAAASVNFLTSVFKITTYVQRVSPHFVYTDYCAGRIYVQYELLNCCLYLCGITMDSSSHIWSNIATSKSTLYTECSLYQFIVNKISLYSV